jgi:hypothetical protein
LYARLYNISQEKGFLGWTFVEHTRLDEQQQLLVNPKYCRLSDQDLDLKQIDEVLAMLAKYSNFTVDEYGRCQINLSDRGVIC